MNRIKSTGNGVVVIGYLFKATVDFINITNDDRDNPPNSTIVQCLTIALLVDHLFRSFSRRIYLLS